MKGCTSQERLHLLSPPSEVKQKQHQQMGSQQPSVEIATLEDMQRKETIVDRPLEEELPSQIKRAVDVTPGVLQQER